MIIIIWPVDRGSVSSTYSTHWEGILVKYTEPGWQYGRCRLVLFSAYQFPGVEVHARQLAVAWLRDVNVEGLALVDVRPAVSGHLQDSLLGDLPHTFVESLQIVGYTFYRLKYKKKIEEAFLGVGPYGCWVSWETSRGRCRILERSPRKGGGGGPALVPMLKSVHHGPKGGSRPQDPTLPGTTTERSRKSGQVLPS